MLEENRIVDMFQALDVPYEKRPHLLHNLKLWANYLESATPEQTDIFLQDQGNVAYLFSNTVLMIVSDTDTNFRYHINFFSLNEIKHCELKMNGFEMKPDGENGPNSEIELDFKIGDENFTFRSEKLYAHYLVNILTKKILLNI